MIGHHGLRRGEAVGAGWDNAHLDGRPARLDVLSEIVMDGSQMIETAPKTDQSMAAVVVDRETVQVLKERRRQQRAERKAWNAQTAEKRQHGDEAYDWLDTGKIWTAEDGSWIHPDVVSREFDRIMHRAGLPPINLRDLRHCAAGLVKRAAGTSTTRRRSCGTARSCSPRTRTRRCSPSTKRRSSRRPPRPFLERGGALGHGLSRRGQQEIGEELGQWLAG
ncbi:hypothetical protein [Streptomyces avermitilis]|uniref:hypothetical protein n=1 Tax=Streptomyces avermitilis TaxID=33903 RepID=UPI0033BE39DA